MSIEAMKQALELLMVATFNSPELQAKRTEVINAGLAAIKQAGKQEPVAWMVDVDIANYQGQSEYRTILAWNAKPVWSGTHEINEVLKAVPLYTTPPAAPAQEPVAEVVEDDFSKQVVGIGRWLKLQNGTKLYTAPPAAPVQEPVKFLANGTRFKISYDSRQSGGQIRGIPPELGGRWVTFVAAEDDCHLKLTTPPAAPYRAVKTVHEGKPVYVSEPAAQRQWVGLTDEEYEKAIRDNMLLQMNFAGIRDDIEAKLRELNGGQA